MEGDNGSENYQEVSATSGIGSWTSTTCTSDDINLDAYVDQHNYLMVNPLLVKLVKQKLRRRKNRKDFTDHYLYLCSTIAYLATLDRRYKDSEFVPVNYTIITRIISQDYYKQIAADLKEWQVLEFGGYQVGVKSRSFKLKSPYNKNFKRKLISDKLINSKLIKHKIKKLADIKSLGNTHQYLAYNNTLVEMDVSAASIFNRSNYFSEADTSVYDSNFISIYAYRDHDYRFVVDDFSNRVHTNLTNLSSQLRRYLRVDGERLGQVDIKNSQPLFFYLHIKAIRSIPESEKEEYRKLVESGLFYEFFMNRLDISPDKRSDVKKKILAALFFDRVRENESRYLRVFRDGFPSIANYCISIRKEDHTGLAKVLQSAESSFVIGKVATEFIARKRGQFINTIHDSVVVKQCMLEETEQLMWECFSSEGIKPNLLATKF